MSRRENGRAATSILIESSRSRVELSAHALIASQLLVRASKLRAALDHLSPPDRRDVELRLWLDRREQRD